MSSPPAPSPVVASTLDVASTLRTYRQRTATTLLTILTTLGAVLVALYMPAMLGARAHGVIVLALALVGISVTFTLRPSWPLEARVGWLVATLWVAAVPGLFSGGDRGVYTANFLGSVLLAALLLGWRLATLVLLSVTALFALVTWGYAKGALPLPSVASVDPNSTAGWVGLWLTLAEIAMLIIVGSALMDRRIRSLVEEQIGTVTQGAATLAALTREREEREALAGALAETLSSLHTGLWEYDVATGRMTCSGEMHRLMGCSVDRDALRLEMMLERAHPDDRARVEAAMQQERAEIEYRVKADEGATRWLRATISSTLDEQGAPRRVRGLVVDITSERANARQMRRLAEVASRTGNPVVVTDLEGRIEWVNEAFTRLTGWALDEIEGKRPGSFLQAEHTDVEARGRMARAIAAREPFDCEVLNVTRDGRQYWVHIEARVMRDDAGAATGFVAVETDVTERRIAARRDSLAERVAALLLKSDTVQEAGRRLVNELVAELDVRTAQMWLVEPGKPHLTYVAGAAAAVTGEAGQVFLDRTRQLTFGPGRDFVIGVGVPGTAWGTRSTAVLPIMASVGSRRLEAATAAGVISFCGTPVHGPTGVLAVLEVGGSAYYPGHELLPNLLERVAEQVAAFLLHDASRRAFQTLFDRSPDGLLVVNEDGSVHDANARASTLFERPEQQPIDALLDEGAALVREVLDEGAGRRVDDAVLLQRAARGVSGGFSAEVSASSVTMAGRRAAIISVRDLTERHRMEAALTQSLREKETLLREVHHRVKNNLQIVSSLLSLQADEMEPGPSRDALAETVFRVRSMSYVHQQLYGTENLDGIDFGSYARTLCNSLLGSLDPSARVDFEVEPVEVSVDTAVPCGLVLNELVTNALKHGRSADGSCQLRIVLRREGEVIVLGVSDRGPGFPGGPPSSTSLGMQLIKSLSRQLSAKVEYGRDVGASVTLRLKRPVRERAQT